MCVPVPVCVSLCTSGRQCYVSPGESNSDHQAYTATFIFYYLQLSSIHSWVGRISLLLEGWQSLLYLKGKETELFPIL